jgi:hypothetical protein
MTEEANMLALAFDPKLPPDLAFAQVVVKAAEHFALNRLQIRESLSYIIARNEIPESHMPPDRARG